MELKQEMVHVQFSFSCYAWRFRGQGNVTYVQNSQLLICCCLVYQYASTGRSSLGSRHTDTTQSSKSLTPRKQPVSPFGSESKGSSAHKKASMDGPSRRDNYLPNRGYYSLGSATARASKLQKANVSNASDYGVAISIKGIKGQWMKFGVHVISCMLD